MSVESRYLSSSGLLIIVIKGQFDYNLIDQFRQAYRNDEYRKARIVVDLREVTMVDSAALGMLLNMKQHLGKGDGDIGLKNCTTDVLRLLSIVRFDKIFCLD